MLIIPLQQTPAQTFTISLSNQACQIAIYQKEFGLFMDLAVNGESIVFGEICQNQNRIVRYAYLGFIGDFGFYDTQGIGQDPDYTGLGTRYKLIYFTPSDLTYAI